VKPIDETPTQLLKKIEDRMATKENWGGRIRDGPTKKKGSKAKCGGSCTEGESELSECCISCLQVIGSNYLGDSYPPSGG